MELIDKAREAMEEEGITPLAVPVRGGTDGARLSYMGLPCPQPVLQGPQHPRPL